MNARYYLDGKEIFKKFTLKQIYSSPTQPFCLLGQKSTYDSHSNELISKGSKHLMWFSYRSNIPNPVASPSGSSLFTDSGWGCTLRVAQMMFAHSFIKTMLLKPVGMVQNIEDIRKWIAARMNDDSEAELSIRAILEFSKKNYGVYPGEFFRPATAIMSLRDAFQQYQNRTENPEDTLKKACNLQIITQVDGHLNLKEIKREIQRKCHCGQRKIRGKGEKEEESEEWEARMEYLAHFDCLEATGNKENASEFLSGKRKPENERNDDSLDVCKQCFSPVLVVVFCLVGGVDSVNAFYFRQLQECISLEFFGGMVAGQGGRAFYVVGHSHAPMEQVVYLDPHYVQDAVPRETIIKGEISSYSVEGQFRIIPFKYLDSSIAISYFLKSAEELQKFEASFSEIKTKYSKNSFMSISI